MSLFDEAGGAHFECAPHFELSKLTTRCRFSGDLQRQMSHVRSWKSQLSSCQNQPVVLETDLALLLVGF